MNSAPSLLGILSFFLLGILTLNQCSGTTVNTQLAFLHVDASEASAKKIPNTLFGLFFEEINHAGAGGLWAELVSNRGFEAGGQNTPSNIDPWSIIGDESSLTVSTERSSYFERNKIALRLDIHCSDKGANTCPYGGVGVYNPGFWGMNIEEGKSYKLAFHVRSLESLNVSASLTSSDGLKKLASAEIISGNVSNWTKIEVVLEAKGTDHNSRLELTTTKSGVIWFDQVSLMPLDTYKGHGFRNDLFGMIKDLKPGFLRFPGGCFVEGEWLRNAFRWKETIGPWEERPGHFGDVWHYWTDDGLGHLEFLQLAEDLGALPVWVFNNGISHNDQVDTSSILPFVQEILDGIEFARGDLTSTWGSVRAALGHPQPFDLRYVAIGNEDCWKSKYRGNYLKFYSAIKQAYPDINIISNCDASSQPLNHPADLYDYHIYSSASDVFSLANKFNHVSRSGPKAFVSEYAVTAKQDCGKGSLLAALAEAGFLIGVERNGDAVEMASYAPLFVNENDRTWSPDAIVFTSSQAYGTPSYWMQQFFSESNGATLLNSTLTSNISSSLLASAITWQNPDDNHEYLRIKAVNFGASNVTLKITVDGLEQNSKQLLGSTKTLLTSSNVLDENSFTEPTKVAPTKSLLQMAGEKLDVVLFPHSLTSFDFLLKPTGIRTLESDSDHKSSY